MSGKDETADPRNCRVCGQPIYGPGVSTCSAVHDDADYRLGRPFPLPRPQQVSLDKIWTLSEEARRDIEEIERAIIRG